jgi:hypothetical protein
MTSKIRWDVPPPSDQSPLIPIYRAVAGHTIRLVAVCSWIERVRTHFAPAGLLGGKPQTLPCQGDDGCVGCHTLRLSRRWYGYLGCYDPEACRLCIAELTAGAVRQCDVFRFGRPGDLRGWRVRLYRRRGHATAPAGVEFDPPAGDEPPPPPFNVRGALQRIWGVEEGDGVE